MKVQSQVCNTNKTLTKLTGTWIHLHCTSSNWKKLLRSTARCRLIQNRQNQRLLRSPLGLEWPAQSGAGQMKSPPNCLVEFFTLREIQSRGQPSPRSSCLAASAGVVVWWCVHQWHAALSSRLNFSHRSLSMRKEGVHNDVSSILDYGHRRTLLSLETWTKCYNAATMRQLSCFFRGANSLFVLPAWTRYVR